ncbi:MAG: hypothetical protein EXR50_02075 [Dehalococcoidia bacterium]|nr:hypothetical protein [Dehalococcoidia bacterium]
MIRVILPTDVVSLLAFENKALANQVVTKSSLSKAHEKPGPVGPITDQWLSLENYKTWVSIRGLTIEGLVSVHSRPKRTAWEVEWLVLYPDPSSRERVCLELLQHLAEDGVGSGVEVIFLRLPVDSRETELAKRAGFWPFSVESLLTCNDITAISGDMEELSVDFRPKTNSDNHGIFRLYHAAMPQSVKEAEGLTLAEWMERNDNSLPRGKEYVFEEDGMLKAWLFVSNGGGVGQFDMIVHPSRQNLVELTARYAISKLKKGPAIILVPEYQYQLKSFLTNNSLFDNKGEYSHLMRHLAVRIRQPQMVPARA